MPKPVKQEFLDELKRRFPSLKKSPTSQSLFEIAENSFRIYIRYSKVHPGNRTFFGLRQTDLCWLQGHRSVICFLWDEQPMPLLLSYGAFEDVFTSLTPAQDGQFKVQVFPNPDSTELYIANAGRFNVEGYFGWNEVNAPVDPSTRALASKLTHSQVQTLLGAIGFAKGNDIWYPQVDRAGLDWSLTEQFPLHNSLPQRFKAVEPILSEVDVVWMRRGAGDLVALYEVEHTTSIYSGLLRFNDVHLITPDLHPRFSIVSNDVRRSLYVRQINRPTFQRSGLSDICTFMEYENVMDWHNRLKKDVV
ncbi:MAG TPA: hypothetical protein VFY06_11125 [Verrucomicrobiae bacterium]|nr:hypothetical protein [Verrucomicrobiae bacterium]